MTQAIVSSLPIDSRYVPGCLENIIDKKVSKIALNWLQKIVDWICTRCYCPYNSLYQKKLTRVHLFSDQTTRLFDATRSGITSILRYRDKETIALNNRRIQFSANLNLEITFSKQTYTDYVVIRDDPRQPGWVQIIEQELSRPGNEKPMEKTWSVNSGIVYVDNPNEPYHLVEQPRRRLSV